MRYALVEFATAVATTLAASARVVLAVIAATSAAFGKAVDEVEGDQASDDTHNYRQALRSRRLPRLLDEGGPANRALGELDGVIDDEEGDRDEEEARQDEGRREADKEPEEDLPAALVSGGGRGEEAGEGRGRGGRLTHPGAGWSLKMASISLKPSRSGSSGSG
jgi:hypothetical protein